MNKRQGGKNLKYTKTQAAKSPKKEVYKNSSLKDKLNPKTVRVYDQSELAWHHSKPYRKRYLGSLIIALLVFFSLFYFFGATSAKNSSLAKSAKGLVTDVFGKEPADDPKLNVDSTYGFSFEYSSTELYASGIDSATGQLYVGPELKTSRAYNSIRIAPNITKDIQSNGSFGSLDFKYYSNLPVSQPADLSGLQALTVSAENPTFESQVSRTIKLDNQDFLKTEWRSKPQDGVAGSLSFGFTSYLTSLNGRPFVAIQRDGIVQDEVQQKVLGNILNSLKFNQSTSSKRQQSNLNPGPTDFKDLSLIDRLTLTSKTSAAIPIQPGSSEKISTLYSPAVVKVYNFYCMDILINGQPYLRDVCKAQSGSGFLVGGSGVVGTNGHVAVNRPIDVVIEDAINRSKDQGDDTYINRLISLAGVTEADVVSSSQNETIGKIIDKFYSKIPEATFAATNNVDNILVSLGQEQPDVEELISLTKNRQLYPNQKSIKHAELKGYDYRAFDGLDGFKASDIAVLKVEGQNYPSVSIGDANQLNQGSELSIIGYPGAANNNGLVDSTHSLATLTSGKVSSLKKAAGSDNNLIETDATIGHGNSGGPAFNEAGKVVGIATYTIDGSGEGNGTFNYVRDIADFSKLAGESSVSINTESETQKQWEEGIELFYQARYSKSLNNFAAVERLYPEHPKASQFISLAQKRIASGEEVKNFPVTLVISGIIISLITIGGIILVIIRHKKKNKVYRELNPPSSLNQPITPSVPIASSNPPSVPSTQPSAPQPNQPQESAGLEQVPQLEGVPQSIQPEQATQSILPSKELIPASEPILPAKPLNTPRSQSEQVSAESTNTQSAAPQTTSSKVDNPVRAPDFHSLQNSQHIPDKSRFRPSTKFSLPVQSNRPAASTQPRPAEESAALESSPTLNSTSPTEVQSRQF
ncbi:trypsin-like peptidase domain-containing protein [Candidatus Saccharibacteria bacterium]|nr:trypsin-like peptidase domain-containing protein [Candidatus Saccharibacteria bacterium]